MFTVKQKNGSDVLVSCDLPVWWRPKTIRFKFFFYKMNLNAFTTDRDKLILGPEKISETGMRSLKRWARYIAKGYKSSRYKNFKRSFEICNEEDGSWELLFTYVD